MFLRDRQILSGAARDGVYAVNLKLIAWGNWRNVGVIDYQIGIKREKIQNEFRKKKKEAFNAIGVKLLRRLIFDPAPPHPVLPQLSDPASEVQAPGNNLAASKLTASNL